LVDYDRHFNQHSHIDSSDIVRFPPANSPIIFFSNPIFETSH
jgi:hypothetical protein